MLKQNIRRQVLLPLTLTFIILTLSFMYASYRIRVDDYERSSAHRYTRVQHILKSLVSDRTRFMTSSIDFIAEQQQFQNAIRSKDRQALLRHGRPILKRLFSQQQITHFYFYDKNGAIVLRVYDPQDDSASPMRFTRQQAMARGEIVSGLELGRNGTFTLRVVYPWKIEDELIGYIELGQEFDHILKELRAVTLIDFAVTLNKKLLDRESWEHGMKLLGRTADWDLLADQVFNDQTVSLPAPALPTLLEAGHDKQKQARRIRISDRTYGVRSFPLQDSIQREVGQFILITDLTESITSFRLFIMQVLAFSLLLCTGLFIYSYRLLGRVDQRLRENRERLNRELEQRAESNRLLETEVIERQRAEASLVTMNEQLEQRVLDRTNQLEQLNRHLETSRTELQEACKNLQSQQATILQQDRMACIGQLAASVAHDINNPIGFVYGNLEVLKNYWGKLTTFLAEQDSLLSSLSSPEQRQRTAERRKALKVDYVLNEFNEVLEESLEGAERVNRIVLNLKGFSRLDEKEPRLADIHECLESTLNIVRNELRYKANIKKEYGDIPKLVCYPQQLNQVFMNLLINAAQAIEHWGEITIRTWTDRKNVFIAIGDTGCGIPEEHCDRIFEPFFSTKAAGGGTGLGLSIVREILRKHHAEVTVSSKVGEGTVITLQLPLEKGTAEHGHA